MQTISPPPSQYRNRFRLLKSSISVCVGESLAVCKLSWKTAAYCYGKCSLCQLGTFSSRKYHVLQGCRCILLLVSCHWNGMRPVKLQGERGWLQGSSEKFHNKGTPVFSISHPREGGVRWLRAGMHTREIPTWREQNEVIIWTK